MGFTIKLFSKGTVYTDSSLNAILQGTAADECITAKGRSLKETGLKEHVFSQLTEVPKCVRFTLQNLTDFCFLMWKTFPLDMCLVFSGCS